MSPPCIKKRMSGVPIEPPHAARGPVPPHGAQTWRRLSEAVRLCSVGSLREEGYVRSCEWAGSSWEEHCPSSHEECHQHQKNERNNSEDTYRALKPVLPKVTGWKLEVCPACIIRDKSEYGAGISIEKQGRATLWIRMWEDMWILYTMVEGQTILEL